MPKYSPRPPEAEDDTATYENPTVGPGWLTTLTSFETLVTVENLAGLAASFGPSDMAPSEPGVAIPSSSQTLLAEAMLSSSWTLSAQATPGSSRTYSAEAMS